MTDQASAADLIEQAQAATTNEELDAVEAQANDRVTVLDAVSARRAELAAEPALASTEPQEVPEAAEPPPPPIEAPPVPESLAEQVYRESREMPESTGPSDYVPNRPNIRPPVEEEATAEAPPETEPEEAE